MSGPLKFKVVKERGGGPLSLMHNLGIVRKFNNEGKGWGTAA